MKIKKYILAIILLFISALGFVGCADIEFIRAVDATDVIVDKLVIELDESALNKKGIDLETVISSINDDMVAFRLSVESWKLQFASYPEIEQSLRDGIYVEVAPVANKISLTIQFSNWQMFGLFYGYSEVEDFEYKAAVQDVGPFINQILNSEYTNEDYGLFFIKYSIIKSSGIIGKIEDFEYLNINFYEKYINLLNNRFTIEDISISQIFAYPDDRIYSNADEKMVEGNMTFLMWDFESKSEDFEMSIYKLSPKTVWWYSLALILSAIAVIVFIIIIHKKYKNEPQEKITRWDVEKDG